jgi:hypothetical protein
MSGKNGKRGSNKGESSSSTGKSARSMRARSGIKRKRVETESKEEISEVDHSLKTTKDLSSDATSSSSSRKSPAFERSMSDKKRRREEKPNRRKKDGKKDTESKEEISEEVPSSMITVPPSSSVAPSSSPLHTVDIKSNSEVSPKEPERRECEAKIKELDCQLEEIQEQIAGLDHQIKEGNDLENLKRLFMKKSALSEKDIELSNKLTVLRYQLEQLRQTPKPKCVHIVDFLFDLFLTLVIDYLQL